MLHVFQDEINKQTFLMQKALWDAHTRKLKQVHLTHPPTRGICLVLTQDSVPNTYIFPLVYTQLPQAKTYTHTPQTREKARTESQVLEEEETETDRDSLISPFRASRSSPPASAEGYFRIQDLL